MTTTGYRLVKARSQIRGQEQIQVPYSNDLSNTILNAQIRGDTGRDATYHIQRPYPAVVGGATLPFGGVPLLNAVSIAKVWSRMAFC